MRRFACRNLQIITTADSKLSYTPCYMQCGLNLLNYLRRTEPFVLFFVERKLKIEYIYRIKLLNNVELRKFIATTIREYLNEQMLNNLTLYRGEEKEWLKPTDNTYSFFAHDKSFAEDYGDYVWKCTFKPMNLFISYDKSSINELYINGFKLRDTYIEDNWGKGGTSYDEVVDLYDYDESKNSDNWGYKSANHVISSPFFNSDTWEMIEHTDGVLDYIFSKYDGVVLLEGGQKSYYLRTDKIINCEREEK